MSKFLASRAHSFWIARDEETPTFHELPRLDGNFAKTYSTTTDETIVAERGSKTDVITGSSVGGDFNANLRLSQHYDLLRMGAMQAAEAVTVSITAPLEYADGELTGADFTEIKAGDYFRLTHAAGSIVTFATADGTASALACDNIPAGITSFTALATSYLETGDTQHPMILQKRVNGETDAGAAKTYYRTFKGVEVFTWSVSMQSGSILTEAYNLRGLSLLGGEKITGQTDNKSYSLSSALGAVKGVKHIDFDNVRHGSCFAQNFEFSLDNAGEEATALGSEGACSLTYKDPVITGTLNTYSVKSNPFAEEALIDSQASFPLAVTLFDQSADKYMVIAGTCSLNSLDKDMGGSNTIANLGLKYGGKVRIYTM